MAFSTLVRLSIRKKMDDRSLFRFAPQYHVNEIETVFDWSKWPGAGKDQLKRSSRWSLILKSTLYNQAVEVWPGFSAMVPKLTTYPWEWARYPFSLKSEPILAIPSLSLMASHPGTRSSMATTMPASWRNTVRWGTSKQAGLASTKLKFLSTWPQETWCSKDHHRTWRPFSGGTWCLKA